MYANVFTKSLAERVRGVLVASAVLALMLLGTMALYRGIDLSLYTALPEPMRALMGIPSDADAATLSYRVVFGTMGALTIAGLAISLGASTIAGEERDRTLGLLLGNPRSRTEVLVARGGAMVALVVVAGLLLWGAAVLVPALLGVDIGSAHVGAVALHLTVVALFHGVLAMAIGAATGRRGLASGVTAATLAVSFVAVGLLPLVESLAGLARVFPWWYFEAGRPLQQGVAWGHVAVLVAGMVVLAAVGAVGMRRRDLRTHDRGGAGLVQRLREHPAVSRLVERLGREARVSSLRMHVLSRHQGLVLVVATAMFLSMGVVIGVMYSSISAELATAAEGFPDALLAIIGSSDMGSPEGFYQAETFGLMLPIAMVLVTSVVATRGIAGEEEDRTMGLLLANPVTRSRLVAEVAVATAGHAVVVGVATFLGVWAGSALGSLGLAVGNIAAICTLGTLLGILFGALALLLAAAGGSVRQAVTGTVGVAIVGHVANAFLPLDPELAGWARLSPFHHYTGNDPLVNGMDWGHATILLTVAVVLVAAAAVAFERRDLRTH